MTKTPHIILLILDSTRSDFLGCYGSDLGLTPHIDALAEHGMVFGNHYAASCGSAASHTSIFTGQHPARHGMLHNLCEIRGDLLPMPLLLKHFGYRTFGHCKMSFVPPVGCETLFGFGELLSPGNMGDARVSWRNRISDLVRSFPPAYIGAKKLYRAFASPERQIRVSAGLHDGRPSVDYILDRVRRHAPDGPVFAYSTLLHPHLPTCPPKEFLDRVFRGAPIHPDAFRIQLSVHAYANGDFGAAGEALDSLRKLYMADLMYADHLVGVLVEGLRASGLLEDTLLIVTSDHGELLGEHGCINHGAMLWEELFRTPCVMHWPGGLHHFRTEGLTSGMDILPTVFDLLGELNWLRRNTKRDGASAARSIHTDRYLVVDSPPAVLPGRYAYFPKLLAMVNVIRRAVRTREWKYVWQSDGDHRLYGIVADPGESVNLFDLPDTPRVAAGLHKKMTGFYRKIDPDFRLDEYPVPISPHVRERITDERVRRELAREGYA